MRCVCQFFIPSHLKAEFKDGILTLTLPKVAQRRQAVKINLVDDTNTATSEAATQANQTETAQAV